MVKDKHFSNKFQTEKYIFLESVQQDHKVSQLVVPEKLQTDMFLVHVYSDNFRHKGNAPTLSVTKREFIWPAMDAFVSQKIKECGKCICRKIVPSRASAFINILGVLNFVDIFSVHVYPSIGNTFRVPSLYNLKFQKFSFLYIRYIKIHRK